MQLTHCLEGGFQQQGETSTTLLSDAPAKNSCMASWTQTAMPCPCELS